MEADRKLTRGNPTEHNMISESPDLATCCGRFPLALSPEGKRAPFHSSTSITINPARRRSTLLCRGYNGPRTYKENATMNYRRFGRTGWNVSEIGYGMWGMAGWTGSEDAESLESLQRSIDLGCNFFDTAWAYGDGHSEQLLGKVLARTIRVGPTRRFTSPQKFRRKIASWPSRRGILARRLLSARTTSRSTSKKVWPTSVSPRST